MKTLLSIVCFFISVNIFAQPSRTINTNVDIDVFTKELNEKIYNKEFPAFSIKQRDDSVFSNANLSNKIVFVNFWFEACKPCMKEMDGLNELYAKLSGNPDFMFVSFTFDPDSTIQKQINLHNIKYKVHHINTVDCTRLNFSSGFPSSFILDRKGIIKYFKAGGQIDNEKSTQFIMNEIYPEIIKIL